MPPQTTYFLSYAVAAQYPLVVSQGGNMPGSNPSYPPPYDPSYERGGDTGGAYQQSGAQIVYHAAGVPAFRQASGGPQYGREVVASPPHAGPHRSPGQAGGGPGVLHDVGQGRPYGPAGPHTTGGGFP